MATRQSAFQQQIVAHDEGPILVVTNSAAGNARVLTARIRALLRKSDAYFRILALTFSNTSAADMLASLETLGEQNNRVILHTFHGFCLELIFDRENDLGMIGNTQFLERPEDRRHVLMLAVGKDPRLSRELEREKSRDEQRQRLDHWLRIILSSKANPLSTSQIAGSFEEHLINVYNSELISCRAADYEDLPGRAFRLLTQFPEIADLYRRIYRYILIDEAHELTEAQYGVVTAFCGENYRNIMMVGDSQQSICGQDFSNPRFMEEFAKAFHAKRTVDPGRGSGLRAS